jgi:hypothetical protein
MSGSCTVFRSRLPCWTREAARVTHSPSNATWALFFTLGYHVRFIKVKFSTLGELRTNIDNCLVVILVPFHSDT